MPGKFDYGPDKSALADFAWSTPFQMGQDANSTMAVAMWIRKGISSALKTSANCQDILLAESTPTDIVAAP
jgi:hypothetical protein